MSSVTTNGFDVKAIEREPIWLVFDVDFSDETASATQTLATLPVDSVILDAFVNCTTAATGTGPDDVDLKAGSTQFFTGTSDNGGTINVLDVGASKYQHVVTSSTTTLAAAYVEGGTATAGPVMRVCVLVYRPSF